MRSYSRDKMCALKSVCSFSAVLILYALSNMRSSNKNVVLTQRYPKTCGLNVCQYQPQQALRTPSLQHIFIGLPTCHYNLTPHLIVVSLHTHQSTPKFNHFQNSPFFGSCWQIHFFCWPKIPLFNAQNSTYIRATDLQTSFYDLQIP